MAPKRNNVIPNGHFKKDWQTRVRCFFDQPTKKKARRVARQAKFAAIAPRPTAGLLRPVVRCPTFKYNTKVRYGRGFSLAELKEAGISRKKAPTIGICVDHRRVNKSVESLQTNIQRLKEYKAKLIELPKKKDAKKEAAGLKQLVQRHILPIVPAPSRTRARTITEEERSARVFQSMRMARAEARLAGARQKRSDEKLAEEAIAKKG